MVRVGVSISIHALTKSATAASATRQPDPYNFNPRTHKECDSKSSLVCAFMFYFNPRTHKECDQNYTIGLSHDLDISIHALTKSATSRLSKALARVIISIHALTKSATTSKRDLCLLLFDFNPRTHKECDNLFFFKDDICTYFNPRTHKECDLKSLAISLSNTSISIHALTKSATRHELYFEDCNNISIHALTKSATPNYTVFPKDANEFQSTHSQRVRLASCQQRLLRS